MLASTPNRDLWTRRGLCLLALAWLAVGVVMLAKSPLLGDHEAIVAQIARETLLRGDWLVPYLLDTPFLVKPPLVPWIVSALAFVLPNDTASGLPVTDFVAKLPSLMATALTIWILYQLACTMFKRRTAQISAFVYATSLGTLLYMTNATAEAMLTLFCTWAFAEFWWFYQSASPGRRRFHLIRFYVALGLAMLAKGPMPLSMVAIPIAVWWWLHRPTQMLATGGRRAIGRATRRGLREILPRFVWSFTRLGVWWGLPLFLLFFVPWMVLVAQREPHAWALWSYEYVGRLQGQYPGQHHASPFYYLPILFGYCIPWCLSLPEAMISPFLPAHRHDRKSLTYAWYWLIVGTAVMSVMTFKHTYYIVPALPGGALLLGPVLERFFFAPARNAKLARGLLVMILVSLVIAIVAGWFGGRAKYPDMWHGRALWVVPICAIVALAGVAATGILLLRGHRESSCTVLGTAAVLVFAAVWFGLGPAFSDADDSITLTQKLDEVGVPADTPLLWASNRPDSRVRFYGHKNARPIVDTDKLIARHATTDDDLRMIVGNILCEILKQPEPVYILLDHGQLNIFRMFFNASLCELFSIDRGKPGRSHDDWIVVTQAARSDRTSSARPGDLKPQCHQRPPADAPLRSNVLLGGNQSPKQPPKRSTFLHDFTELNQRLGIWRMSQSCSAHFLPCRLY